MAGTSIVSCEYAANNGTLSKKTYANGDYIRYTYDSQDRLSASYYYSAATGSEQTLHTYVYDKAGDLYKVSAPMAGKTYTLSYDFLGRLMRVADESKCVYQYTYDAENNMTLMRHEADGSYTNTWYTYDKDSRETVATMATVTRNTAYDAWGRPASRIWKNGSTAILTTTYEYPDSGVNKVCLPSAVVNGSNRIEYTYDNNGNITSIKDGTATSTYPV